MNVFGLSQWEIDTSLASGVAMSGENATSKLAKVIAYQRESLWQEIHPADGRY